jgi:hypothetical protein
MVINALVMSEETSEETEFPGASHKNSHALFSCLDGVKFINHAFMI